MIGLMWHRAKALRIIRDDFGYNPAVPGFQSELFNGVTKQMRKIGGNEYDSAIAFMLSIADTINYINGFRELPKLDKKIFDFMYSIVNNAAFISRKANLEDTRNTALDIFDLFDKCVR